MKSPYDIVQTVLITEKTGDMQDQDKYVFKVSPEATKIEVGQAIEKLFDVKVKSVNIMNCKGKPKRVGRTLKQGRRANWKKAIITLSSGSIDLI